jgi:hypothetical protein
MCDTIGFVAVVLIIFFVFDDRTRFAASIACDCTPERPDTGNLAPIPGASSGKETCQATNAPNLQQAGTVLLWRIVAYSAGKSGCMDDQVAAV